MIKKWVSILKKILHWMKETHEKGEGSTKRAILRGLECISFRTESGGPSSSSLEFNKLSSSIVIFVASSFKLFLLFTLFKLSKLKNGVFLQKGIMGFAPKVLNLIEFSELKFEEWMVVEIGERKGWEREEFIERDEFMMKEKKCEKE